MKTKMEFNLIIYAYIPTYILFYVNMFSLKFNKYTEWKILIIICKQFNAVLFIQIQKSVKIYSKSKCFKRKRTFSFFKNNHIPIIKMKKLNIFNIDQGYQIEFWNGNNVPTYTYEYTYS